MLGNEHIERAQLTQGVKLNADLNCVSSYLFKIHSEGKVYLLLLKKILATP